jgi:hypothetical protein
MTANQEEAKMETIKYIAKKFDRMCKTNSKYYLCKWMDIFPFNSFK